MSQIDYAALLKNAGITPQVVSSVPATAKEVAAVPSDEAAAFAAWKAAQAAQVAAPTPGVIAPAAPIPQAVATSYAADNPFAGVENAEVNEYGKPPLPRGITRDFAAEEKKNIVSVAGDASYDLIFKKMTRCKSRAGIEYMKAFFTVIDGNGDTSAGSDVEIAWFKNSDFYAKELKSFAMGLVNLHKSDATNIAKALQDLIHPAAPLAGRVIRVRSSYGGKAKKSGNDYFKFAWTPIAVTGMDEATGKPKIAVLPDNRGL